MTYVCRYLNVYTLTKTTLYRLEDKVDKMEFTIGSIVTKIDAVLSKMDTLATHNGLQPIKDDFEDDDYD